MNRTLHSEAAMYVIIAMGAPLVDFLGSDRPLTGRAIACTAIVSIVAGANALKAFMSTSYSRATADAILVRDTNHENTTTTPQSS